MGCHLFHARPDYNDIVSDERSSLIITLKSLLICKRDEGKLLHLSEIVIGSGCVVKAKTSNI